MGLPKGWDATAHAEWEAKRPGPAIAIALARLNSDPAPTADMALQACYYLFLQNAFAPARDILERAVAAHPGHLPLRLNAGVLCTRTGDHVATRHHLEHYIALGGTDVGAFDGLAGACHKLGDDDRAADWGRKAIAAKTEMASRLGPLLTLGQPRPDGASIIAFSLWGSNPRYLRGAVHNALRAPQVYPDFRCRFYLDASVPDDLVATLQRLGAETIVEQGEPSNIHRLTRRFLVADDPSVRRYLVRDCDSLVNAREAASVGLWIDSGRPFHVMRDWWTHSDPILAGMWAGMGGVLPPLAPLIATYKPKVLETPNWDQWFLRDRIWPSIRANALVHDRCFHGEDSEPFPGLPPRGNLHVGQDEYAVRREEQAEELAPFKASTPSLQL
ncbi:tetratricopeptide repeat protein [Sphingomonas jaspsi]|uniref:tetratricopeptide repeat protein n=1 Tax=Sphingomonas jaspsi TaxID=392409 RepID=UPI0004B4C9EA|nr:hypothetical protein [Sphingomonas jaspsi]